MGEKIATQERLTNYDPTDVELLQMLALKTNGIMVINKPTLQRGLKAAAENLALFEELVDLDENSRFWQAFFGASLKLLNNEQRWGIPTSDPSGRKVIETRMDIILTLQGKKALERAAIAANKVWSERAI